MLNEPHAIMFYQTPTAPFRWFSPRLFVVLLGLPLLAACLLLDALFLVASRLR